ncbi:MAG: FHA domain-containing protein [Pyrinomonadaceae bacterium]
MKKKVTLHIKTAYESENVELKDEISIGRTDLSDIKLDDPGLSSVNTTIFRDENEVVIVDENSTNGTFLNGKRLGSEPKVLFDGDEISLGSETTIEVSIGEKRERVSKQEAAERSAGTGRPEKTQPKTVPNFSGRKPAPPASQKKETPMVLIVAAGSTFAIIFLALVGILVAAYFDKGGGSARRSPTPRSNPNAVIPIRVIDPLGGQKQENLDELTQYWEVQEKEVQAGDLADIASSGENVPEEEDFSVSVAFWEKQKSIALQARDAPTGISPPGMRVPPEFSQGFQKQGAKIREMKQNGYELPMDFADLAKKRKAGELVELKMATEYWVLEVGGSSSTGPFSSFNFESDINSPAITQGSNDFNILLDLASNFSGVKYDISNPDHRRQMKIRLLRMFHPRAKPILMRIAQAYFAKFKRPLRVTSLSRSMEYQISLNKGNPNSFRVRGAGSLPPHTSGCAFDLARKHMTAEEQNFIMETIGAMEREGILDALIEGNLNACFHVFIYYDGVAPRV